MKLFHSKILLFGEYGITKSPKGLVIPYDFYKGMLKTLAGREPSGQEREDAHKSNEVLKALASYLETLTNGADPIVRFNIEKLNADIADGMYFDNGIPQGYRVGSSGALMTAIYNEYAIDPISTTDDLTCKKLLQLRAIFGRMESLFHGTSSGLDPLNSYLSLPILINSYDNTGPTGIPTQILDGKEAIFPSNSDITGETTSMVHIFMENMENEIFQKMSKEEFIKYTDACIDSFLKRRSRSLPGNIKNLSSTVLNHFKPMIPREFYTLWKQGIDTGDYFLKLRGLGGGGCILSFTEDLERAKRTPAGHKLEVVYQF